MQKKLVYIIPCLGMGGAEVALLSAIPKLCQMYDCRIVCLRKCDPPFIAHLSDQEKDSIVSFSHFPFNYIRALFYILNFRPNILITSLWKAAILGVIIRLLRRKIRYIEFIHNSVFFHSLDRYVSRLAMRRADVVFCDSESAQKFVKQWTQRPTEIISFLRFPSPPQWNPKRSVQSRALFIGRFHEQKRVDRIVDLIDCLKQEGVAFTIDLYGRDDGTMSMVQKRIKEKGLESCFCFMGEVPTSEVINILPKYDFYFQTSEIEGMAMSVVEAMQQGLVCILTPAGEIGNYAQHGVNAIVIPSPFNEALPWAVTEIKKTLNSLSYYNSLSHQAFSHFSQVPTFPHSFTNAIQNHV